MLIIPKIGFGTGINHGYIKSKAYEKKLYDAIWYACEKGVVFFDTAEIYGNGRTEAILGEVLSQSHRENVMVSSKFSPEHNTPDGIRRAIDGSLKRLKTDTIALYQMHWSTSDMKFEECMKELLLLKEMGLIQAIGMCNLSLGELKRAHNFLKDNLFSLQMEFNYMDRYVERDIYPFCRANNIKVIAYSPLNQGKQNFSEYQNMHLLDICDKYHITRNQLLLSWLISKKDVSAIPASLNSTHIDENMTCVDIVLEKNDICLLDKLFAYDVKMIAPNQIVPVEDECGLTGVYHTVEEALENKYNNTPSPVELSEIIKEEGDSIKPIRVSKNVNNELCLVEGRIRYWAWVIAFGSERPIPCLIR